MFPVGLKPSTVPESVSAVPTREPSDAARVVSMLVGAFLTVTGSSPHTVGPDSTDPPSLMTISAVHSKVPVDCGTKVAEVTVLSASDSVVTGTLSVKTGAAPSTPQVPGAHRKKTTWRELSAETSA